MYLNKWYYKTVVLNIGPRMRPRPTGPCVRARPVRPQPSAHPAGPPADARSRLLGWAPLRCASR